MARKSTTKSARPSRSTTTRRSDLRKKMKPKPMKIAALIASAIQDLRETKGSTPGKIIDYISYGTNLPEGQVKAALKRGVEFGILRRRRGHYYLPTENDLTRANRIALRFSKISAKSKRGTKKRDLTENEEYRLIETAA